MRRNLLLFFISTLFITNLQARVFEAEGADLIMGVGPEEISKGGAVSASTNDLYSIFWNPAGLSEIKGSQFVISKEINGKLTKINYIGLANSFYLDDIGLKLSLAFAYHPRLFVKTDGTFYEDEPASIFSLFTLPLLSGNYTGKIDSKTNDYRFALAVTPLYDAKWSAGLSIGYINCGTTFAGRTMEDPNNYKVTSTKADTLSLGVGFKYYTNDNWTQGTNIKNIDTVLDVETTQKDDDGVKVSNFDVPIPLDITFGVNWQNNDDMQMSMDYQNLSGSYGGYDIDFQFIRTGFTYNNDESRYHFGLLTPLRMYSSKIKEINLPVPVLPTFGYAFDYKDISLALAFFAHPVASYTNDEVVVFSDLSLKYNF